MSKNELRDFERIDARDVRALTEPMTVCGQLGRARGADDLYLVVSTSEYLVDVREGVCECPDHQYRDANCKHLRRITYEAGMRPIPSWVERSELDEQLLTAEHIDGEPVFSTDLEDDSDDPKSEPAIASAATPTGRAITDGGEILEADSTDDEDERPDDCTCVPTQVDLPCWPCWRAGFYTPNPDTGGEA